jgi:hypothetical protein
VLEAEFHFVLSIFDFASEIKAEHFIEDLGAAICSNDRQSESLRLGFLSHPFYHKVERLASIASALVFGVNHKSPQVIRSALGVLMQHDETDWCLASIYRAEPSIPAKMSLGNRNSVWSYKPFLTIRDTQIAYYSNGLSRDYTQ